MITLFALLLMFAVILWDQRARGKPSRLAWTLVLYLGGVFLFRLPWVFT